MLQANLSVSAPGVLRGMHFHRRQWDVWVPLEGTAFIALTDLRTGSPVQGQSRTEVVDAAAGLRALVVSPGVAHGFCALGPVELLYLVTAEYDGTDEHGFRWDDPDAGIDWPLASPVLSPRDREAGLLAAILADPPPFLG